MYVPQFVTEAVSKWFSYLKELKTVELKTNYLRNINYKCFENDLRNIYKDRVLLMVCLTFIGAPINPAPLKWWNPTSFSFSHVFVYVRVWNKTGLIHSFSTLDRSMYLDNVHFLIFWRHTPFEMKQMASFMKHSYVQIWFYLTIQLDSNYMSQIDDYCMYTTLYWWTHK